MTTRLRSLVAFVLLASAVFTASACAEDRKTQPFVGYAAVIAGNAADLWTTQAALNRGAVEVNPFMGQNATIGRISMVKVTSTAGELALVWLLHRSGHSKAANWLGVAMGGEFGLIALHNHGVSRK